MIPKLFSRSLIAISLVNSGSLFLPAAVRAQRLPTKPVERIIELPSEPVEATNFLMKLTNECLKNPKATVVFHEVQRSTSPVQVDPFNLQRVSVIKQNGQFQVSLNERASKVSKNLPFTLRNSLSGTLGNRWQQNQEIQAAVEQSIGLTYKCIMPLSR